MSESLPLLSGERVLQVLQRTGFEVVRLRGSHVRLRHPDGRVVTVPVHGGDELGRGLLRKILRDAELTREQFQDLLR